MNSFTPFKLLNPYISIHSGIYQSLVEHIKAANPDIELSRLEEFNRCNSVRIFVKTGDLYILFDGNQATYNNSFIYSTGQNISENVPIQFITVCGVDSIIIVQIGYTD